MAYVISDECISCGACAAECPVSAISEGDAHYEINPDVCIECGACNSTCPVGAPNPQQFNRVGGSDQLPSSHTTVRTVRYTAVSIVDVHRLIGCG